jgi:hypothetical protein
MSAILPASPLCASAAFHMVMRDGSKRRCPACPPEATAPARRREAPDTAPDNGALWDAVADRLEAIAADLAQRAGNPRLGEMARALGLHTAREIAACAAELRANITILEAADV